VQPSGNTARSSPLRYSSTIIQFISLIRISQVDPQISGVHADLIGSPRNSLNFTRHRWACCEKKE